MFDAEQKGERAAQVLENEVFQEAVVGARGRIQDAWAREASAEARERLWHKLQAIDAVTLELKVIRDNGVKSRVERERADKRKET